eukprot:scaffold69732_cov69-Phaeocystis_antarctica.AAC.2
MPNANGSIFIAAARCAPSGLYVTEFGSNAIPFNIVLSSRTRLPIAVSQIWTAYESPYESPFCRTEARCVPSELYATEPPPAPPSVSVSSPVAVSKTLTDWELAGSAGFLKPTARCLPSGLYATEATVDGGPNFVSHGERGLESTSHVFTYPSVSPVVTLPPSRAHATELMPAMVHLGEPRLEPPGVPRRWTNASAVVCTPGSNPGKLSGVSSSVIGSNLLFAPDTTA